MNIAEILDKVSVGGVVSVLVILLTLIEITPIKVSPLAWIGKRVNGATLEKVDKIDKKLDEHIAQSYRSKILNFQTQLINEGIGDQPKELWKEVINACDNYEKYVKDNNIQNGMCEEAIKFIKTSYQTCLTNGDFASIK